MNFRMCAACGHIFNVEFDYDNVPYEDDSNLMYNRGSQWMEHMKRLAEMLVTEHGARGKVLVDIGCGDGLFLRLLLDQGANGRCIGFEPGMETARARENGLSVQRDYFRPENDLKRIRPDFLICRHVLEHLHNPRDFVAEIAYWCNRYDLYPILLAEVPQIDKAVRDGRVTDFLYEHVSNFTELSFRKMFESSGLDVLEQRSCYGDEVAVAVVRPRRLPELAEIHEYAYRFRQNIDRQRARVRAQIERFYREGRSVAFWGGTGKGAAFLNAFAITAEKSPTVVDSDLKKLGRYVPGTGQEIRSPAYLKQKPVDVIVITTRWRAKDIFDEIRRLGLTYRTILVLGRDQLEPYPGEATWGGETNVRIESEHRAGAGAPPSRRVLREGRQRTR